MPLRRQRAAPLPDAAGRAAASDARDEARRIVTNIEAAGAVEALACRSRPRRLCLSWLQNTPRLGIDEVSAPAGDASHRLIRFAVD